MIRRALFVCALVVLGGSTVWLGAAPDPAPVATAAMQNDTAAVRALLQQGQDVNTAQGDGMTALHWAAINGNVGIAGMLVAAGADVEASTRLVNWTPLHLAAKNGRADMVAFLLAHGADARRADAHGTTPLMLAAASGSTEAVSDLLAAGADPNAKESVRSETALMFAAAAGRADAIKVLLAHGADWRATSRILDWTKLPKDDPRFVQFGTRPPPKPGAKAARPGAGARQRPAPDAAATLAANHAPAKPQGPSKKGPKPLSYTDLVGTQGGLTALMFAARQGNLPAVEALVAGGADVNEVDPGDKTSPLLIAIINGQFDTADYLLNHGADPNAAQVSGAAPLYDVLNVVWAPKANYPEPQAYMQQKVSYLQMMRDLLAHGANPNARLKEKVWYTAYNFDQSGVDESGATPFWRAAYADDIDAMKLLVAHGADPNLPTIKPAGRPRPGGGVSGTELKDKSGLPPVPVGGPDIPPILAASGEAYGSSFTANHHSYAPTGMLAAVKYLVEVLHADVNARDADGNTALHNAAARGDNAMVLYLVSKGANVRAINRKGQTVADMANGPFQRTQPFPETIALLEKLGAKILNKCISC